LRRPKHACSWWKQRAEAMPTPNPKRTRAAILAEFITRLSAITMASGFLTDAGQAIYCYETPQLGPDDPAIAIAVVPRDEEVTYQGAKFYNQLPVEVQAVCRLTRGQVGLEEFTAIENLLTDIKSAIESGNRLTSAKFGGLIPDGLDRQGVRTVPREPGSTVVAVGIPYLAPYSEDWGDA
jgi:hypothetical protein